VVAGGLPGSTRIGTVEAVVVAGDAEAAMVRVERAVARAGGPATRSPPAQQTAVNAGLRASGLVLDDARRSLVRR
jgi:hypothetical protein